MSARGTRSNLEMVAVGLNKWIAGLAVAVLASAGAALLPASASAATNLINNPGFETGSTSGWTCSANNHTVTSPVHSGADALTGTPTSSDFAQCTQVVAVQPNSAYTLTDWVIGSFVYLGDTGTGTTDTNNWTPGATSYTQLSTSFNTGASTTSVTIYIHGWYAQPTYFADDVSLTGPGGTVTVPSAPTGLSVTGTSSSSVSLSWTGSSGATGYNVYRNGTKVGSPAGTSFTDSGLAASTSFTYQVTATNSAGESAKSASVSGTTSAGGGTTVPAAPTGLSVTGTSSSSVSLSWTGSSGATGYNVYRNGTKVASPTSTSFTDGGLAASTTFTYQVTATNSAGESAKSGSVSGTTSAASGGGGGGGLPAHVLTGYWQDFTNGATPLRLSAVPTTYDLIAVAFANATGTPGGVSFAVDPGLSSALGGYTDANFTSDVATVHSRGQKVIISVGGQNGTISVSDSTSANNFANSVNSMISQFGFDGVDIDLENGVNPTFMSQALHSIASAHPGVIITLAPQTIDMQSTGNDYFQLALNIKSILTIVNMQYYNSGSMLGCDQNQAYSESTENFMTALACIQLQGGLSPSQVALGLPANANGAGSGAVAPSLVNSALDCLDMGTNCGSFVPPSTWPGLRGAMDWSINWDAANGFAFANTVHPHLATLK